MTTPARPRVARRPPPGASRGQTLVFFALASLVLMGALGLVLDGGYAYAQRRAMQNAADAAALAGAKALAANTGGSFGILDTARAIARSNGVADPTDPAQFTCELLQKDGTTLVSPCTNGTFASGTNVAAVRVRTAETHQTFVMRVLGIASTGSAATATAQVKISNTIPAGNALFLPCGVNTKTVADNGNINGAFNILAVPGAPNNYLTYGTTDNQTLSAQPLDIVDGAYSFYWNPRPDPTNPTADPSKPYNPLPAIRPGIEPPLTGRPRFLIHKGSGNDTNGIARCNTTSSAFKGYNGDLGSQVTLYPEGDPKSLRLSGAFDYTTVGYTGGIGPTSNQQGYFWGEGTVLQAGQGNQVGPASTVPGAAGCRANVDPNNCVLILPIIDNAVSGGGGGGSNSYVAGRKFGAFWIEANHNGSEHYGRLIKDYPITADGMPIWTPGTSGIQVITLIR